MKKFINLSVFLFFFVSMHLTRAATEINTESLDGHTNLTVDIVKTVFEMILYPFQAIVNVIIG